MAGIFLSRGTCSGGGFRTHGFYAATVEGISLEIKYVRSLSIVSVECNVVTPGSYWSTNNIAVGICGRTVSQ